ncbi:MAG: hypothetical protein K8R59_00920 [Thermoanaerobaculales bacterium]|nr:hypothetical protein [Thermoanaerobaculales bacterium]
MDDYNGMVTRSNRGVVLVIAMVALLSVAHLWADDALMVVHVFSLRHAAPVDVSAAVQPLLSAEGSITVFPAKGRVTVRDRAEVVSHITEVVDRMDRAPEAFHLRVELLEGSHVGFSLPDEREIDSRLKKMFPFKAYRVLGMAEIMGETGDDAEVELGGNFRVRVTALDHRLENHPFGLPDHSLRLKLQPLVLEQINDESVREVIRTKVLLSENQEVFIGAGSAENSSRGIVLIIKALPGMAK